MSPLTNVWRQLVERRLWPVAILLIAALAAVPLALAQDPEPAAPAPAGPAPAEETALTTQPIVAQATAADRAKRRKVLGEPKNPFGLPEQGESGSAEAPDSDGAATAKTAESDDTQPTTSTGGGSASPATGTPTPAPVAPEEPAEAPDEGEITVRFAGGTGEAARESLDRLAPLPSASNPVLIYMGLRKNGKAAEFLLDHGVEVAGDAECLPRPEACESILLRVGETEFLDVAGADGAAAEQYQLDLVEIHADAAASAAKARGARAKATRRALVARAATVGLAGYRSDQGGLVGAVAGSVSHLP